MLGKVGNDLSRTVMVFPGKRASLFFNDALSHLCTTPIWSPQYTTISELFRSQTSLVVADHIQLVFDLHDSYQRVTGIKEDIDTFYGWGEVMLSDFDDIDKHLADAGKVFTLLGDLHEQDNVEYLTEEQKELLSHFFRNFSKEHNSELKQRFLRLWNKLFEVYTDFRSHLQEKGLAYEGMLYRNVVEAGVSGFTADHYVFVGFNLLNPVEEALFDYLKREGKAMFYWDYDHSYMKDDEAGQYISRHLEHYPNELDNDSPCYSNIGKCQKEVVYLSAPTDDLQARYVSEWLTPERIAAGHRTAIVLTDESLLPVVLHCLPPTVKDVNITSGYPLSQTPVASLVRIVMSLWQRKSLTLRMVNSVLRHPYVRYISPNAQSLHDMLNQEVIYYPSMQDLAMDDALKKLFSPLSDAADVEEMLSRLMWLVKTIAIAVREEVDGADLHAEALYRMYMILQRLSTLAAEEMKGEAQLFPKLLQQIISTTTIPFHGEPIKGIQIMGVLETRALDFDHLLILSCNEGNMPARINENSFIPHSVRRAYELTTIENKVAVYAYNFKRLLQRATDIHITYNRSAADGKTGEMSRFMLQLMVETSLPIERRELIAGQGVSSHRTESVPKQSDNDIIQRSYLSPTALSTYLRCRLRFYYKYIKGIDDNVDSDEETMDSRTFGNIFHKSAELLYQPYEGREVTADFLDGLLTKDGFKAVEHIIDQAFRKELFKINDSGRATPRLGGLQLMHREMVKRFMRNIITYDRRNAPFTIVACEEPVKTTIEFDAVGGKRKISITGIIDRLDTITLGGEKKLRVLDYKTGKYAPLDLPDVEAIFDPHFIMKHSDYYLQTILYSIQKGASVPALLYAQQADRDDYSPTLNMGKHPLTDVAAIRDEFLTRLRQLIEEIYNPAVPYDATPEPSHCNFCPYATLCGR